MKDRVVVPDKQNGSLNVLPELDVFVSDVRLDIYEYILIINKLDGFVDFGFTCGRSMLDDDNTSMPIHFTVK